MIDKSLKIQRLTDVKVIIGNGFDIHCGLMSTYADYFNYYKEKYASIGKWVEKFQHSAADYLNFKIANWKDFWKEFVNIDNVNVWDVYFYLVSYIASFQIKDWKWCDIETKIYDSICGDQDELNWDNVFKILIEGKRPCDNNVYLLILAAFTFKKHNEQKFRTIDDFYNFLLEQLKEFERIFGFYIRRQHIDERYANFGEVNYNKAYFDNAYETLRSLCNIDNIISIDSFNYGTILIDSIQSKLIHINGDYDNPIFGIDSSTFDAYSCKKSFSKTSRRIDLDIMSNTVNGKNHFKNIIIYGHSLNKADYGYFFSIFDELGITDEKKNFTIVIAFTKYNDSVGSELKTSVMKMFEEYALYKGYGNFKSRFLDILNLQNKIIFYEIPEIKFTKQPTYFNND